MSHSSKIFNKVPVQVPNKSGFDLSHENLFTAKCGTLTPIMCQELLPNDTVSLGAMLNVNLPPMATDFYGRVDAKVEAFFVPNRLLYGGWQKFITHYKNGSTTPSGQQPSGGNTTSAIIPPIYNVPISKAAPGTLLDYLGFKTNTDATSFTMKNPLPLYAYHRVWDDWYRDQRLQTSCFTESGADNHVSSRFPYTTFTVDPVASYASVGHYNVLQDGTDLFDLRQRNFSKDYFTNAALNPQQADGASLTFDTSGDDGTFTISALRAANSLQQWLERNNVAGENYYDQIVAQFGARPSDYALQRSVYLGSMTVNVYNKSVYQSAGDSSTTNNPFNGVGAKYASSQAVGDGSLIDKFTATEHGYILVLFSLVPHAYYSTGTHRMWNRTNASDYAFPILANMGDQAIKDWELTGDVDNDTGTFGYTQIYSEYKYADDEVHGLLRDGQTLENFALQRTFDEPQTLGSDFIEIPTTYMDQVTAVDSSLSSYGCWVDSYLVYKKSSTLPVYSIPSLGDMKNTHTELVDNGGRRL